MCPHIFTCEWRQFMQISATTKTETIEKFEDNTKRAEKQNNNIVEGGKDM